jgi:hypothetical protein
MALTFHKQLTHTFWQKIRADSKSNEKYGK